MSLVGLTRTIVSALQTLVQTYLTVRRFGRTVKYVQFLHVAVPSPVPEMTTRSSALTLVLALLLPAALIAQSQPLTPKAGSLSGRIVDDVGRPIEDADVLLYQTQQRLRSRADGSFSFDALSTGKYTLEARHLGFTMQTVKVTLKDSGAVVIIKLKRVEFFLPAVLTTANRGGLSGVISDTGYRALHGVSIQVIGANASAESDSTGAFFIPLKVGSYLVEIKKSGFARQLVSVTVPPDEGRKLAAWMVPQRGGGDAVLGKNIFDLRERVNAANNLWSSYYTREDLKNMNVPDIRTLGSRVNKKLMNPDCPVMVNGDPHHTVPLWSLTVDELEFVEVYIDKYAIKGNPRTNAADLGGKSSTSQAGASTAFERHKADMAREPSTPCGIALIAWLKN